MGPQRPNHETLKFKMHNEYETANPHCKYKMHVKDSLG